MNGNEDNIQDNIHKEKIAGEVEMEYFNEDYD